MKLASPNNVNDPVQETFQAVLRLDLVGRLLVAGRSALLWSLNPWEVYSGAFQNAFSKNSRQPAG